MSFARTLKQIYFDFLYNPVYDFTTAQTSFYRRQQKACIDRLELQENDSILCIGVGTGNEVTALLKRNRNVHITGVDTSIRALKRAHAKAKKMGIGIKLLQMDALELNFPSNSFDKVLCLHVMGFIQADHKATEEAIRVLKGGGQFVITYPSGPGSIGLLAELVNSVTHNISRGKYKRAAVECAAVIGAAAAYIPGFFWVKPKQGFHSRDSLIALLSGIRLKEYSIEEDNVYQDFIVCGRKHC